MEPTTTGARCRTLPLEILEHIIGFTDFYTAIETGCAYVAFRLFDRRANTWQHAFQRGSLRVLRWMAAHDRRLRFRFGNLSVPGSILASVVVPDVAVFRWIEQRYGREDNPMVTVCAARKGYVRLVAYLLSHGYPGTPAAIVGAAQNGHLPVVRLLHERRDPAAPLTDHALELAVEAGRIDVVHYLAANGYTVLRDVFVVRALRLNHFPIGRWYYEEFVPGKARPGAGTEGSESESGPSEATLYETILGAADHGNIPMLEWALSFPNAPPIPRTALLRAIRRKDIEMIRYIWARTGPEGSGVGTEPLYTALFVDYAPAIDFFIERKVALTSDCYDYPAVRGDLPLLQRLTAAYPDVQWNPSIIQSAAMSGDVATFAYVSERFRGVTVVDIRRIASHGCFDMLRHLHDHFNWIIPNESYRRIALSAAHFGYLPIVQWAFDQFPEQYMNSIIVISGGHTDVIRWLLGTGRLPINFTVAFALHHITDMGLLRDIFLLGDGTIFRPVVMNELVRSLDVPTLQWILRDDRCKFSSRAILNCFQLERHDLLEVFLRETNLTIEPRVIVECIVAGRVDMLRTFAQYGHVVPAAIEYAAHVLDDQHFLYISRLIDAFCDFTEPPGERTRASPSPATAGPSIPE